MTRSQAEAMKQLCTAGLICVLDLADSFGDLELQNLVTPQGEQARLPQIVTFVNQQVPSSTHV